MKIMVHVDKASHASTKLTRDCQTIAILMSLRVSVAQPCLTLCDPHGLYSPSTSPGWNSGVGSLSFLQGNLPDPGIEPRSPTSQADSLPAQPPGKPLDVLKTWQ